MPRPINELLMKGQSILIAGQKSSYQVSQSLKENVFKAYIQGTSTPVMMKTPGHPVLYSREVCNYEFDCIKQSPYIRSMREVIENADTCMIFEWMDSDIWSLRRQQGPPSSLLLKTVARSVLGALEAFVDMDGEGLAVHTDVNPNNILVSGAESHRPIVKLADLGGLVRAGHHYSHRLQGFSIRAPEIWMGHPPSPACDVWSVGVSLAHFIAAKTLFGFLGVNFRVSSVPIETSQAACSIAKIIRLIGPITRSEDPKFTDEFDVAEIVAQMDALPTRSLEEELKIFGPEQDCLEFIRWLLTLDPGMRPTAKQALEHPWLQSLD